MELQDFKIKVLPVRDRLYRIALKMLGSVEEAEDTLQDVMIRLWDKRAQLDAYNSVEALAVTATKNLCLDKLKSKKHKNQLDVQEMDLDSGFASPHRIMEIGDSMDTMNEVFSQLPSQQRLLITLRDIEGFSYQEISEQTGLEINNIRVGLSRARKKAKENYLKIENYELR